MFDGEGKEKNLRFEDQLCRRGGGGIPNNGPYESRNEEEMGQTVNIDFSLLFM